MPASHGYVEGDIKELLPCGRRLVVIPHETPNYKGSIILPDSVKSVIPTTGTIKALGFDLEAGNPFKEGDRIVFSKYGGVELTFTDHHRLLVVHEDDVLAIIGDDSVLMGKEGVS